MGLNAVHEDRKEEGLLVKRWVPFRIDAFQGVEGNDWCDVYDTHDVNEMWFDGPELRIILDHACLGNLMVFRFSKHGFHFAWCRSSDFADTMDLTFHDFMELGNDSYLSVMASINKHSRRNHQPSPPLLPPNINDLKLRF